MAHSNPARDTRKESTKKRAASMQALRACKREALDCNPKGYHDYHPSPLCPVGASGISDHGFPSGNNQGPRPCMVLKSSIWFPLQARRRQLVYALCF